MRRDEQNHGLGVNAPLLSDNFCLMAIDYTNPSQFSSRPSLNDAGTLVS
jgi:hypothetical protein